jgi:hypothetical protein
MKGVAYKAGLAKAAEGANNTKISEREYQELGDDYIIRSILGAAYTLAGMYAIGLLKSFAGDDDEAEDAIVGTSKNKQFTQEKVESIGNPKQSVSVGGRNLPLQLLGNQGVVLGMYADYLNKRKDPEYAEKSMLFIGGMIAIQTTVEATWFSNASKYGGLATSIISGKGDKSSVGLGKIAGGLLGSQIPFNRLQTEVATVMNPTSQSSTNFGINLANQLSIVRAFANSDPNFDYRGRIYEYGDIYVNSADGVTKMFSKAKYGDEADKFLSKINFAATDAYRETKEADNYNYAVENADGTKRFMTNKEYYSFKLATAKQFNKLVESTYKNLDNKEIILNGKVDQKETDKFKKEKVSEMLNYSKKLAFKEIQAKSGFTPPITNDNKIVRDAELKTEKLIKKLEALGADIFIELKTND